MNNLLHICGCQECTAQKTKSSRSGSSTSTGVGKIPLYLHRAWPKKDLTFGFSSSVPEKSREHFRDAYSELNKYTQLNFKETSFISADSRITVIEPPRPNWLAWASYPTAGDIGLSSRFIRDWTNGKNRDTIYHEIGHSIGYAHTFEHKDLLPDPVLMNSRRYSLLAYAHRGEAQTFQALDIESFRATYGTKKANTGNDTYVYKNLYGNLIVDDGGFDTLDLRGVSTATARNFLNILMEGQKKREHTLLSESPKRWISKLNTSVLEQVIMPDGSRISLSTQPPAPNLGRIELGQLTGYDHKDQTISFSNQFKNPVVFVGPITTKGGQPAIGTVQKVNKFSFETDIEEPLYLDNWHLPEKANYAVVEQGKFDTYEAGVININDLNKPVKMPDSLSKFKYVFTQSQNQEVFYVSRQDTNDKTLMIQTEELYMKSSTPFPVDIEPIELAYFATDSLEFAKTLGISQMQTNNGDDTAWLRINNSNQLYIEEEQSFDREVNHTTEIII